MGGGRGPTRVVDEGHAGKRVRWQGSRTRKGTLGTRDKIGGWESPRDGVWGPEEGPLGEKGTDLTGRDGRRKGTPEDGVKSTPSVGKQFEVPRLLSQPRRWETQGGL